MYCSIQGLLIDCGSLISVSAALTLVSERKRQLSVLWGYYEQKVLRDPPYHTTVELLTKLKGQQMAALLAGVMFAS